MNCKTVLLNLPNRLIIGSNSISGVGELSMNCKDKEAAENLQETVSFIFIQKIYFQELVNQL